MYKKCTGTDLEEVDFEGMQDEDIKQVILLKEPASTLEEVNCILSNINKTYRTPNDKKLSRSFIIKEVYERCIWENIYKSMSVLFKGPDGTFNGVPHDNLIYIVTKIKEKYPIISDFKQETRSDVIRALNSEFLWTQDLTKLKTSTIPNVLNKLS